MKENETSSKSNHAQKALVAAGETGLFALAGLVFPPAFIGMAVTGAETLRQEHLAIKDTIRKLKQLEKDVEELEQRIEFAIRLSNVLKINNSLGQEFFNVC